MAKHQVTFFKYEIHPRNMFGAIVFHDILIPFAYEYGSYIFMYMFFILLNHSIVYWWFWGLLVLWNVQGCL